MKVNEEAVSEAVGFILILGIVISGIGLVTLYGYPVLIKEQSSTDIKNMERAMIVLQNDQKSLCFKNVPYKESSLQVTGGTLEVINASDYPVSIEILANGVPVGEYFLGAMIFHSDRGSEVITLENGAVVTRQEGTAGSAMLAEPRWFYDNSTGTFVAYIMKIVTDKPMARSGMATVRMNLANTTVIPVSSPDTTVLVTYNNDPSRDHSTAWRNYLTSNVGMQNAGGDTYTLSGVDKLVIKEYTIQILGI